MSNMSYCRFENTVSDLIDCKETMEGMDEYYQSKDDLSEEEYDAMMELVEACREIVDLVDSGDCVLMIEGEDGEDEDEEDGENGDGDED